jgi:hypothetical protein
MTQLYRYMFIRKDVNHAAFDSDERNKLPKQLCSLP